MKNTSKIILLLVNFMLITLSKKHCNGNITEIEYGSNAYTTALLCLSERFRDELNSNSKQLQETTSQLTQFMNEFKVADFRNEMSNNAQILQKTTEQVLQLRQGLKNTPVDRDYNGKDEPFKPKNDVEDSTYHQITALRLELTINSLKLQSFDSHIAELKDSFEKQINELKEETNKQITGLNTELETVKADLNNSLQNLSNQTQELTELRAEMNRNSETMQASDSEMSHLKAELKNKTVLLQSTNMEIGHLKQKVNTNSQNVQSLQKESTISANNLKEIKNEIMNNSRAYQSSVQQMDVLKDQIDINTQNFMSINKQVDEHRYSSYVQFLGLTEKWSNVSQTVYTFEQGINKLKNELTENSHNLTLIQKVIVDLQDEIYLNISQHVSLQNNQTDDIRTKLSELRGDISSNSEALEYAKEEINITKGYLDKLSNKDAIAFSVYMTHGILEPDNDTYVTVPLSGIEVNLGGHFDTNTSSLSCPKKGSYYFVYTIHSGWIKGSHRDNAYVELVKDGVTVNKAICSNYNPAHYVQCQSSNTALVQCDTGSRVWLQTRGKTSRLYGSTTSRYTTFTGFLLT